MAGANDNGANLGYEATLRAAADKMRGNLDSSDYKHVVLGLIFLKYISDAFVEHRQLLLLEAADPESDLYVVEEAGRYELLEERDEYGAERGWYFKMSQRASVIPVVNNTWMNRYQSGF